MAAKCPLKKSDFLQNAKPVKVLVNGVEMTATVKEFSTGSFGWYLNGKVNVDVGGTSVPVQVGMNLTVVGSKEAQA